jgi:hypothetical protein
MQFVAGGENDRREEEVEEELFVEGDNVQEVGIRGEAEDEANYHACSVVSMLSRLPSGWIGLASKDGQDGFMECLYFLLLQDV